MFKKCQECKSYYKITEGGKIKHVPRPFKDENGKVIWKNLLLPDGFALTIIISLLLVAWAYSNDMKAFEQDIKKCNAVIEKPCEFCFSAGCTAGNIEQGFVFDLPNK